MVANRYSAQQTLPEIGVAGQARIASSKILVVGCGGLAASVLPYLAAAGVGTITLIDNDVISISNLNRQVLFTESDLGLNKALILQQQLEKQNSAISIIALTEKFDLLNGIELAKAHDLVIDCTDSYSSKVTVNYCCIQTKTPLVFASVLGWDGQIALLTMQETADPCYKCFQKQAPQSINNCSMSGILGASVNLIGSHQATLTIQYLLGHIHNANFLYVFDLWNLEQRKFKLSKRHDCRFHEHNQNELNYINYSELPKLESYILIDIRTVAEWEKGHLPGAKHSSPGKLILAKQDYATTDNLVIYCNQDMLSQLVVENLQNLGYKAFVLKGGYAGYSKNV